MSYVIAFSIDGATDVTSRYVRNPASHGRERNRAPEEVLLWITNEVKHRRRQTLSKEEKRRLIAEDQREAKELRAYIVHSIAAEISNMICADESKSPRREDPKPPPRQSGALDWREARGENGTPEQNPRHRDGY